MTALSAQPRIRGRECSSLTSFEAKTGLLHRHKPGTEAGARAQSVRLHHTCFVCK